MSKIVPHIQLLSETSIVYSVQSNNRLVLKRQNFISQLIYEYMHMETNTIITLILM